MRILANNELHRLRHIVAEQANTAQSRDTGKGESAYLVLSRLDAQDVADALEELVALRTQEEDAANAARERQAIIEVRAFEVDETVDFLEKSVEDLTSALARLREAVEG